MFFDPPYTFLCFFLAILVKVEDGISFFEFESETKPAGESKLVVARVITHYKFVKRIFIENAAQIANHLFDFLI
jgi:hypothetical protein